MKEKNIKKNYEAIIFIIVLIVILSCVFAFIRFRTNFNEKYLIDYKYVFFSNGEANIVDFKTGNTNKIPIEQYCKEQEKDVLWLSKEIPGFEDTHENNLGKVYLTDKQGNTEFLFDTEFLGEKIGTTYIKDIAYTENGRIFLTVSYVLDDLGTVLFEYKNGEFIKLSYVENLRDYFWVVDDKLICRTWDDELWALNVYDDTPLEYIGKGSCVAMLNEEEILYFNVDERVSAKKSLVTGEMIPMDFDLTGVGDYIRPEEAPVVSEDGKIAIVYYYKVTSAYSVPVMGIYYVEENKLISIYDYFRWIHLKNPDFDVEWHTKISATLIPAD
ncbi:MAG: hypothetical protein IKJ17_06215 [Clostridia bacterium]|nr:hypothetical protein [Clostridia bacterium]